ncbi:ATP-binding protein [Streptomyces luteolifulvus]|jgi:anti-sigma regulatory factor (Ser/Thr protein kinase)|uniref:ATP-binding protein n=1 Tax=Streptomyces luteolifulvus TaxID=2615112 RepID=A0A6H9UTT3_9ACTN|nr:ATP-binding protein [Streptomyces luteolifulvus]
MLVAHPDLGGRTDPVPITSWPLSHEALSAAQARRLAAGQLIDWGLSSLIDTAQLLISEAVTNAIRHAPGPIRLSLRKYATVLRCDVEDASAQTPQRSVAGDEDEGGRGLALLDALADSWGSYQTPGGKSVWFELPLAPHAPAEAERRRTRRGFTVHAREQAGAAYRRSRGCC